MNAEQVIVHGNNVSVTIEEMTKLQEDAERYRWLRDHPGSVWEIGYLRPFRFICKFPFEDLDHIPATLDQAIDISRAAAKKPEGASRSACPECGYTYGTHKDSCPRAYDARSHEAMYP